MPELLTRNAKMRKSSLPGLWNFGIPAYKEAGGRVTCPMAGACGHSAGCYAQMGRYVQPTVKNAYQWRYEQTVNLASFEQAMSLRLLGSSVKTVRVHDSGDFYTRAYMRVWFAIARQSPTRQFYAYTKMVQWAGEEEGTRPKNWTWIFSYGGKQDGMINPDKDRHSKVFGSIEELKAAGYADASGDDGVALGKNHRIGLLYHGYRSRATLWGK